MDWKEAYVLSHGVSQKQITINEDEIIGYIKVIVDEINNLFTKNNLKKKVEINLENNILILPDNKSKIEIEFDKDKKYIRFTKFIKELDEFKDIKSDGGIFVNNGYYTVLLPGKWDDSFNCTFIDYKIIDNMLKHLFNLAK